MKHTRIQIHHHNSFRGHTAMTASNMRAILRSVTATDEAKRIAALIIDYTDQLDIALQTRKDPA